MHKFSTFYPMVVIILLIPTDAVDFLIVFRDLISIND